MHGDSRHWRRSHACLRDRGHAGVTRESRDCSQTASPPEFRNIRYQRLRPIAIRLALEEQSMD